MARGKQRESPCCSNSSRATPLKCDDGIIMPPLGQVYRKNGGGNYELDTDLRGQAFVPGCLARAEVLQPQEKRRQREKRLEVT